MQRIPHSMCNSLHNLCNIWKRKDPGRIQVQLPNIETRDMRHSLLLSCNMIIKLLSPFKLNLNRWHELWYNCVVINNTTLRIILHSVFLYTNCKYCCAIGMILLLCWSQVMPCILFVKFLLHTTLTIKTENIESLITFHFPCSRIKQ